jgi:mRNA-degrading endonuclease RelE of RelBE toxin-antitoxin system
VNTSFVRHFVAAQRSHEHQNFRLELSKLYPSDIRIILGQITKWSKGEKPGKDYESYQSIYPGLARWRVGDYRLYTYHLGGNVYILLHVYKKLGHQPSYNL